MERKYCPERLCQTATQGLLREDGIVQHKGYPTRDAVWNKAKTAKKELSNA